MPPLSETKRPPGRLTAMRPRVLIVDDEEHILTSLKRLMRREPYEVRTASNAAEALELMETLPAHLIITDHRMPGMNGTELLREVQQRWPETVRIVLSGYSEVKSIIAAINEGAIYKFITKPWNDEELKLNIRRAMEQALLAAENIAMAREIAAQNERLQELNRLLHQRANDASRGLTCAQELVEAIDVGVVTVDAAGLVIHANQRCATMLSKYPADLIGVTATSALPAPLCEALSAKGEAEKRCGCFELGKKKLQWRMQHLDAEGLSRATVIAIWQEVPCVST